MTKDKIRKKNDLKKSTVLSEINQSLSTLAVYLSGFVNVLRASTEKTLD